MANASFLLKTFQTNFQTFLQGLKWVILLIASLLCITPSFAQDDYPNKTITMVVPFPPGGVADVVGRPVAEAMGRYLKQSVIIENKGGAGGGIGMAQVAKSKADEIGRAHV